MLSYDLEALGNNETPLVVRVNPKVTTKSETLDWFDNNGSQLTNWLNKYGAVLFKGLPMASAEDFGSMVSAMKGKELQYLGGIVPRSRVSKSVYTSTELNEKFPIKIHQEMAYQNDYPDRQLFFCHTPPVKGGGTPICDMRKVKSMVDPKVLDKLRRKKIKYVQVLHNEKVAGRERLKRLIPLYVHLTWQETFRSQSSEEVEKICLQKGFDVKWNKKGDLILEVVLPAFRIHPLTGEEVYFNHLVSQHFNKLALKSDLGNMVYYFRKLIYKDQSEHPNQVYYGDGEPISFADMESIYKAVEANTVCFTWEKGDLLIVDNMLFGHGRNSFRGERKILVSLQKHSEYQLSEAAA